MDDAVRRTAAGARAADRGSDWLELKRFTPARVALGRTGSSLPTAALLDFNLAHARARDAVHASLNIGKIEEEARTLGWQCVGVHSAARDRAEYLRRPDFGRRLDDESRLRLQAASAHEQPPELVMIVADGLSALAPETHAVPLLRALGPGLDGWRVGPLVLAEQARVALGDEIGQELGAGMTVMLIGERPGLSAPDSLGVYVTYAPRVGCSDAERNCISNIRPEGLSCELAAYRLLHLLESARTLQLTGVALKDESRHAALLLP